jgi:hypothetical protein
MRDNPLSTAGGVVTPMAMIYFTGGLAAERVSGSFTYTANTVDLAYLRGHRELVVLIDWHCRSNRHRNCNRRRGRSQPHRGRRQRNRDARGLAWEADTNTPPIALKMPAMRNADASRRPAQNHL